MSLVDAHTHLEFFALKGLPKKGQRLERSNKDKKCLTKLFKVVIYPIFNKKRF